MDSVEPHIWNSPNNIQPHWDFWGADIERTPLKLDDNIISIFICSEMAKKLF